MNNRCNDILKAYRFELSFLEKDLIDLRRRLIATNWAADGDKLD